MSTSTDLFLSRFKVRDRYALMPSGEVPPTRLPLWRDGESRILTSPGMGAGFVAMQINVKAGGGVIQPADDHTQTFLYVIHGGMDCTIAEHRITIGPGGYAYVPPATDYELRAPVDLSLLLIRKRYDELSDLLKPEALLGNEANVEPVPWAGNEQARVQSLLPDDPTYDFAMNIVSFDAGYGLPNIESHVAEHGLFILEGAGSCLLGEESLEAQAGDFVWTGPFCPHGFTAEPHMPARMIYFKNVNRDVSV